MPVLANQFVSGKKAKKFSCNRTSRLQGLWRVCACIFNGFNFVLSHFFLCFGRPKIQWKKPSPWWMQAKRIATDIPTDRTFLESILYYSTWNLYPHLLDPFLFLRRSVFCLRLHRFARVEKAKRRPTCFATSILFITFLFISSVVTTYYTPPFMERSRVAGMWISSNNSL